MAVTTVSARACCGSSSETGALASAQKGINGPEVNPAAFSSKTRFKFSRALKILIAVLFIQHEPETTHRAREGEERAGPGVRAENAGLASWTTAPCAGRVGAHWDAGSPGPPKPGRGLAPEPRPPRGTRPLSSEWENVKTQKKRYLCDELRCFSLWGSFLFAFQAQSV